MKPRKTAAAFRFSCCQVHVYLVDFRVMDQKNPIKSR